MKSASTMEATVALETTQHARIALPATLACATRQGQKAVQLVMIFQSHRGYLTIFPTNSSANNGVWTTLT